jgi:hypothetical protein
VTFFARLWSEQASASHKTHEGDAVEASDAGATEWFGGIDVHHVYFAGIPLEHGGVWSIGWGPPPATRGRRRGQCVDAGLLLAHCDANLL